jgi:Glycosyl transferase family 2
MWGADDDVTPRSLGPADAAEVSVVLPTRERPALLAEALRSALGQRGVRLEVLVVDDAPVPGALAVPELGDPRVCLLAGGGRGVSRARNLGVDAAAAPWIAFLDDDDVWAPDKLRRQLDAAAAAGACLVACTVAVVDAAGGFRGLREAGDGRPLAELLTHANVIHTPSSVLVRRDAVLEAGGFDPELSMLADWDLWLSVTARCPSAVVAEPLVAYREHAASMSVTRLATVRDELDHLRVRHRQAIERTGGDPAGFAMQRWTASALWRGGSGLRAARLYARTGLGYRDAGSLGRALLAASGPAGRRLRRRRRPRAQRRAPEWMEA